MSEPAEKKETGWLPLSLLVDFITGAEDETCCAALSAAELEEIQTQGFCSETQPP